MTGEQAGSTESSGPPSESPSWAATFAAGIEALLATLDEPVVVHDLHRLSGGASAETWAFEAGGPTATRRYVLRRHPLGVTDRPPMCVEAEAISSAQRAGVPVPRVFAASDEPSVLGSSYLLMERVEGETIPRRILRDPSLRRAREGMAKQCGRILGHLHQSTTDSIEGLPSDDQLQRYRSILDQLGAASPTFEWAFRHLESHRPDPSPLGLVHGDFRLGNLIVTAEGITSVLDWELAHLGDPLEDLGWLCTKSWRFGSPDPVAGVGPYEDLLAGYAETSGRQVTMETLRWWETLGSLKWGIMCLMQASFHFSGERGSVERAAIGRRVAETEWDLLELLP